MGPGFLSPVPPRARMALRRAHRMLELGDPLEAAQIFGALADQADQHGNSIYAAVMGMSAALAEAVGGAASNAVEWVRRALEAFVLAGQPARAVPAAERVAVALRRRGHEAEAAQVEQAVEEAWRAAGAAGPARAAAGRHGMLPPKCASCGGPLYPDEVEWSDPMTATCPYCGSVVKSVA
jgi:DNA-directed RNA polymerase subunit RPC12/RpoP